MATVQNLAGQISTYKIISDCTLARGLFEQRVSSGRSTPLIHLSGDISEKERITRIRSTVTVYFQRKGSYSISVPQTAAATAKTKI